MGFLAKARNDRTLYHIGVSSGDSLSESPLLTLNTTTNNVVIPNESRFAGEVRNLQSRETEYWFKKNTYYIHDSR